MTQSITAQGPRINRAVDLCGDNSTDDRPLDVDGDYTVNPSTLLKDGIIVFILCLDRH